MFEVKVKVFAQHGIFKDHADRAVEHAANEVIKKARRNLLPHNDSGELSKSLEKERVSWSPVRWRVGSRKYYARWAENGRGWVYPKRAKFLRFKPRGSSTFVFAKKARPSKPINYLRDAARDLRRRDLG